MSRRTNSPPSPAMVQAVEQMFKELEGLAPDPNLVGACSDLPGVVLGRVQGKVLDHQDPRYAEAVGRYQAVHDDYLKALAMHPIGRALALLAFGPEGLALMETGRTPNATTGTRESASRPLRSVRQSYNCHHVIPKSVDVASGQNVNHPNNLVLAKTMRRGRDQSGNPHHFWHSLLLHPQLHQAPDREIPLYVVRPLFPIYPPIGQGIRTAEELRQKLRALGAEPLPELWEKRLLAFSAATRHRPYQVPRRYHEITEGFGDLFKSENQVTGAREGAGAALALKAARFAAEFLPAGAYVNGVPLPPDHRPAKALPVVEIASHLDAVAPSPGSPGEAQTGTRRRRSPQVKPVMRAAASRQTKSSNRP
ncbi:MAG TPA: hypothetical protein VGD78_08360 [Chthoniobacterales bacterium]